MSPEDDDLILAIRKSCWAIVLPVAFLFAAIFLSCGLSIALIVESFR